MKVTHISTDTATFSDGKTYDYVMEDGNPIIMVPNRGGGTRRQKAPKREDAIRAALTVTSDVSTDRVEIPVNDPSKLGKNGKYGSDPKRSAINERMNNSIPTKKPAQPKRITGFGIPLHHNTRNISRGQRVLEQIQLHETMQSLRPDGGGFRKTPMSKKNPRTHSKRPQTRLEKLYARQEAMA